MDEHTKISEEKIQNENNSESASESTQNPLEKTQDFKRDPSPPKDEQHILPKKLHAPVVYKKLSSWSTFMGILAVIKGVILCLGIVTSIIGIPLIFAGKRLIGAVDDVKEFTETEDPSKLSKGFDKLNTYFKVYGILSLIGLIIGFLSFIALLAFGLYSKDFTSFSVRILHLPSSISPR